MSFFFPARALWLHSESLHGLVLPVTFLIDLGPKWNESKSGRWTPPNKISTAKMFVPTSSSEAHRVKLSRSIWSNCRTSPWAAQCKLWPKLGVHRLVKALQLPIFSWLAFEMVPLALLTMVFEHVIRESCIWLNSYDSWPLKLYLDVAPLGKNPFASGNFEIKKVALLGPEPRHGTRRWKQWDCDQRFQCSRSLSHIPK